MRTSRKSTQTYRAILQDELPGERVLHRQEVIPNFKVHALLWRKGEVEFIFRILQISVCCPADTIIVMMTTATYPPQKPGFLLQPAKLQPVGLFGCNGRLLAPRRCTHPVFWLLSDVGKRKKIQHYQIRSNGERAGNEEMGQILRKAAPKVFANVLVSEFTHTHANLA